MFVEQPKAFLSRDVDVTLVPDGVGLRLTEGTEVTITMAKGLTFTLLVNGNLVLLAGEDADAINQSTPELPDEVQNVTKIDESGIIQALKMIYDPEIPVNIYDLGLIYAINIQPNDLKNGLFVHIVMTLTAPGCGMGPIIGYMVEMVTKKLPGVFDVHVEIVFDPPWTQDMMSEEAQLTLGLV